MENLTLVVLSFDHGSVEWNEDQLIHVSAEILLVNLSFVCFPYQVELCQYMFDILCARSTQSLMSLRERGLQCVDELEDVEEDLDPFNNVHPSVHT